MKFSSVEADELAIFLFPMPVSLPGGEVGVSASFRTISFTPLYNAHRKATKNNTQQHNRF